MKNNKFCSGRAGDGAKAASCYEPKPTILPVLGQKGSLTEIPIQTAPAEPQCVVQSAITSPTDRLVERFQKLEPRCRELTRRRLYGLKKRGASATDIETEAQQLPTPPFGPDSQRVFIALAKVILQGQSELLDQLWLVDYIEVPPPIDRFILDERFLGQTLKPENDSTGIWPTWLELLCADYDLDSEVDNAVLTGALGTGKTCTLVVIMLYRMCLATMLRNPQKFYGMNRSSRLAFVLLSITRATVRNTWMTPSRPSRSLFGMAARTIFISPIHTKNGWLTNRS